MPSASRLLTALRAHERASTIPKLHKANTVAWGLLRWGRCCMIVVSHWAKPAWQNMASFLVVVGPYTPHSMPQGGKSDYLIFKKPPLVSRERVGGGLRDAQIMDPTAVRVAQEEDDEERIDEQDIFDGVISFLPAITRR